ELHRKSLWYHIDGTDVNLNKEWKPNSPKQQTEQKLNDVNSRLNRLEMKDKAWVSIVQEQNELHAEVDAFFEQMQNKIIALTNQVSALQGTINQMNRKPRLG